MSRIACKLAVSTVATSLLAVSSSAAIVTSDPADAEVWYNSGSDTFGVEPGEVDPRVGRETTNQNANAIYVFQLPDLGGLTVESATFAWHTDDGQDPMASNVDIYGISPRASADVLAADWFADELDITDATLLSDNYFTAGGSVAGNTEYSLANAALVDYLNAAYGSLGAGSYVFIRLNNDTFNDTNRFDNVSHELAQSRVDGGTATDLIDGGIATLDIVPVPEPASLALLGLGGLMMLRRRH